jgi:hypothetical protein
MSKGHKTAPLAPQDTSPQPGAPWRSGIPEYPTSGQFPIIPQQNYWQGGNFMMPGVQNPVMMTSLLQRFPQLAGLFGGQTPAVGDGSGKPGLYGFPASSGLPLPPPKPTKGKEGHSNSPQDALNAFMDRFRQLQGATGST